MILRTQSAFLSQCEPAAALRWVRSGAVPTSHQASPEAVLPEASIAPLGSGGGGEKGEAWAGPRC